jgi:hypothetical protein
VEGDRVFASFFIPGRQTEEETHMALAVKRSSARVLRLMVGLALLGWPRVGAAQGTWSVISLPQKPGEIAHPTAAAVDAAGNFYVADYNGLQKRDAQGNWSLIAVLGSETGQVLPHGGLAVDAAGNLYVADTGNNRVQKYTPDP